MRTIAAALVIVAAVPCQALAWGSEGRRIAAEIAEQCLGARPSRCPSASAGVCAAAPRRDRPGAAIARVAPGAAINCRVAAIAQKDRALSLRKLCAELKGRGHETGLTVRAELDEKKYPKGLKISDAQLATVNIFPHDFHGEWNYTIAPNKKRLKK
jgi:hypothetical protein